MKLGDASFRRAARELNVIEVIDDVYCMTRDNYILFVVARSTLSLQLNSH